MAFRKLNQLVELSGFFRRTVGNTCQGYVTKHVAKKGGPFYVVELTKECPVEITDKKTKKTKSGTAVPTQSIGLSACKTLEDLQKYVGTKTEIRVTFTGTTPCKAFPGKNVQLYDIEVDDGPENA
jgi:hypothetical protein